MALTQQVNKHTIKNAYLLLLISNLIDKVKDTTIFTKFNIKSGYNNIQIKDLPSDHYTPFQSPNVQFSWYLQKIKVL